MILRTFTSVNYSRFSELYGETVSVLKAQGKLRIRRANKPLRLTRFCHSHCQSSLRRSNPFNITRFYSESLLNYFSESDVIHKKVNMVHLTRSHSSFVLCNKSDCLHRWRFSVRKLTIKQPNVKRFRDREPSRLQIKRKNRRLFKRYFVRTVPRSSILNKIADNLKQYCFQFVDMQHIFINSFAYFKPSVKLVYKHIECSGNHCSSNFDLANEHYQTDKKKLLLSGDIESNPGPFQNSNSLTRQPWNVVLEQRLRCFQLRPFDVGGDGDCFFRAVSHQLCGDPEQHFQIRAAGVAYIRDNPEKFIESNTENSWLEYLNNMSMPGTWSDAIII